MVANHCGAGVPPAELCELRRFCGRDVLTTTITILILVFCFFAPQVNAYSVLAHEATIDFCWNDSIAPLISNRFGPVSEQELKEARAYAYGGSIIQDLGYYPFGSKFLSDLLHYIRSADFVKTMLKEARNPNEYAFAIGALSHYVSDSMGHPLATNRIVPMLYPDLKAKYGDVITYDDKPSAHIKVEFGYDVLQVARGKYFSDAYHNFIGFEVAKDLLDRALQETYGFSLDEILSNPDMAIGTYRKTISSLIPELTKVAWETKKKDIEEMVPGVTPEKFLFRMTRTEYEQQWGKNYQRPGIFAKVFSFVIRILPKVGPFKPLAFKIPTPQTEQIFLQSFDLQLKRYRSELTAIRSGKLPLQNKDLDTGKVSEVGEYRRADKTYAELVTRLQEKNFQQIPPELRQNILAFYDNPDRSIKPKKDDKEWRKLLLAINQLKQTAPAYSKFTHVH